MTRIAQALLQRFDADSAALAVGASDPDRFRRGLWNLAEQLVALEQRPLRAALQQAEAEIDSAQQTLTEAEARTTALAVAERIRRLLTDADPPQPKSADAPGREAT